MTDAPPIRRLRPLAGGAEEGRVELVDVGGRMFVLKRSTAARVALERQFHETMAGAGLPALVITDHPALSPDEMLLEYVAGSPTLGASPVTPAVAGRWGAAIRGLHGIETDGFLRPDRTGGIVSGDWPTFVETWIERALATPRDTERTLPGSWLTAAKTALAALRDFTPRRFVLTHGDLHLNNALNRGEDIVLFDKADRLWSCPAVFDLALVAAEGFPVRYGVERPGGAAQMAAFTAAYGDLPPGEADFLDPFALIHTLTRYPSRFVPEQREILAAVLERLAG